MFAVFSAIGMVFLYHDIMELSHGKDGHNKEDKGVFNSGEYQRQLYHKYRNLLIHVTNVVLVF